MCRLLCMLHEEGLFSRSHGLPRELLSDQAQALGHLVTFASASWRDYEKTFKEEVKAMRLQGVEAGVFGDIDLDEHRRWVERVCRETGVEPLLPLWGEGRRRLVEEFLELGFRATVISFHRDWLRGDWLGRELDMCLLEEMERAGVDPCGEGGEFHTFVHHGPLFREPVVFEVQGTLERDGHLQVMLARPRDRSSDR